MVDFRPQAFVADIWGGKVPCMQMKGGECLPHDPIVCARAEQDLVNPHSVMDASWLLRRWSPTPSPLLGGSRKTQSTDLLPLHSAPFCQIQHLLPRPAGHGASLLTPDGSCVRRMEKDDGSAVPPGASADDGFTCFRERLPIACSMHLALSPHASSP